MLTAITIAGLRQRALAPSAPTGSTAAWMFLAAIATAYAVYAVGWSLLPRDRVRLLPVLLLGAVIQLAPLAGPLLVSADVHSYAAYGRIDGELGGNPYRDTPADYPGDPVTAAVPAAWRDTPAVYGPVFTAFSAVVVNLTGGRAAATEVAFRLLAAVSVLALALLAAMHGPSRAKAAAFVAWNPLLAVHFGGGGHNDATMVALVAGALVASRRGRPLLGGVLWAGAMFVKWIPVVLYPLWLLSARRSRRLAAASLAISVAVLAVVSTFRYGFDWLTVATPLVRSAEAGSRYSLVHRLGSLGLDVGLARAVVIALAATGGLFLLRRARQGRPVVGLAACLLLVVTPWLLPWYAVWAVGLAASERGAAPWLALALGAYLLPARLPL